MKRTKIRVPPMNQHSGSTSKVTTTTSRASNVAPRRKNVRWMIFMIATTLMIILLVVVFLWTLSITKSQRFHSSHNNTSIHNLSTDRKNLRYKSVTDLIANFRKAYITKYGPNSMDWYHNAIMPFGSLDVTAQRLLSADGKFVISFAGYSVTVGRGNYFSQSFPFVLEALLKPILKETLSLELEVRNAAIGGIPSFPYAFCLPHFLGNDPDVISWDYSMNEGNGAAVMESYIRLSQKSLSNKKPMMIVLDRNPQRLKLLQDYAAMGVILDGVSMARADSVIPKALLNEKDQSMLPTGLQNWNEFGAPQGCPGKSSWHPKRAEHEFLGNVLSLYFIDALERAIELKEKGSATKNQASNEVLLTKPLVSPPDNAKPVTQLLYGHEEADSYELHDLSCRTSFLPAQDNEKVLPSIVVDGLAAENPDIMLERSDSVYESGWVLDVSKIERDTKKKVERCGGLGYIDMKIALYGIPESGSLRLWLPYEGKKTDQQLDARHLFDDLILCEANEKRDDSACRLDRDLLIKVGGVEASGVMMNGAGVYLNRQTCLHVEIPTSASITKITEVTTLNGKLLSVEEQNRLSRTSTNNLGLLLDIQTAPRVTRKGGACCISHVVWEQH